MLAMSDSPVDFAALLSRARGGDAAALDQLAREYEPKLRMVARVRLGSALRPYLDSMDLVQSVQRSLVAGLRGDKYDVSNPEKLLALWREQHPAVPLQRQLELEERQALC